MCDLVVTGACCCPQLVEQTQAVNKCQIKGWALAKLGSGFGSEILFLHRSLVP